MAFDWVNGYVISIATTLIVFGGLFYVYIDKIEYCVLRTAILSATRLMLVTQDNNDALYHPAWKKITDLLNQMEEADRPTNIDHIFFQLSNKLTDELRAINVEPPTVEVLITRKALNVLSMWKFVIHNEPQTLRVKVSPRSFAKLITSNTDV